MDPSIQKYSNSSIALLLFTYTVRSSSFFLSASALQHVGPIRAATIFCFALDLQTKKFIVQSCSSTGMLFAALKRCSYCKICSSLSRSPTCFLLLCSTHSSLPLPSPPWTGLDETSSFCEIRISTWLKLNEGCMYNECDL